MKKLITLLCCSIISLYATNIKKLEISGSVNYEIEKKLKDSSDNGSAQEAEHDIDIDIKFEYPVLKETSFIIKVDNDDVNDKNGSSIEPKIDQIYLTYRKQDITTQIGLQEISGPFFYQKNGDGILFLKSFESNIVAFSYYVNNTFSNADEVMQATLIGENDSLNYSLWYSTIKNAGETTQNYGSNAMQLSVYRQNENLKLGLIYSTLDSDGSSTRTLSGRQSQAVLYYEDGKNSMQYKVAYIVAGKDGGNVALDEETDSEANFSLDEVGANDLQDGNAFYLMYSKNLIKSDSFKAEYFTGKGKHKAEEIKLTYTSYLDQSLYYYMNINQWKKNGSSDNQKIELGFNISF